MDSHTATTAAPRCHPPSYTAAETRHYLGMWQPAATHPNKSEGVRCAVCPTKLSSHWRLALRSMQRESSLPVESGTRIPIEPPKSSTGAGPARAATQPGCREPAPPHVRTGTGTGTDGRADKRRGRKYQKKKKKKKKRRGRARTATQPRGWRVAARARAPPTCVSSPSIRSPVAIARGPRLPRCVCVAACTGPVLPSSCTARK
jgi:hypothetical protein